MVCEIPINSLESEGYHPLQFIIAIIKCFKGVSLLIIPNENLDVAHYVRLKPLSAPPSGRTHIFHCLSQENPHHSEGWIWLHLQVECTFLFQIKNFTMFQRLFSALSSSGTDKRENLHC